MISVITWLWGNRSFQPEHVLKLRDMVANNLQLSHEFVCVTDKVIPGVKTIRPPVNPLEHRGCLARLEMLSAGNSLTDGLRSWIWHFDLDTVICSPLDPLFLSLTGKGAYAGIYKAPSVGRNAVAYNPSLFLFRKGAFDDVYLRWKSAGIELCKEAWAAGWIGSDQAILGHTIRDRCVAWGTEHGIFSFRDDYAPHTDYKPTNVRVVSFYDRWPELQTGKAPAWINEIWHGGCNMPFIYDGPLNCGRKLRKLSGDVGQLFTRWQDVPEGSVVFLPSDYPRKWPDGYQVTLFDRENLRESVDLVMATRA